MARMCSTVLVLPPMAMSRTIALSIESAVTISRGSRPWPSPIFSNSQHHLDDPLGGAAEELLALGAGGQQRAVGGQGHAQGLAQAVHAVGREHARAGAAGGAAGLLQRPAARRR